MKTAISALYDKIPKSVCKTGCVKCCINSIQLAPEELERIGGYDYIDRCPHLCEKGCGCYADRPFICRLYGSSELLKCDGCIPERLLTEEETKAIIHEYLTLKSQQENKK